MGIMSDLTVLFSYLEASPFWSAPFVLVTFIILHTAYKYLQQKYTSHHSTNPNTSSLKEQSTFDSKDAFTTIEPLPTFSLHDTPPLKLRPFKPKYHMTMAIENTSISDLIAMDNTFPTRCTIRKTLILNHRHEVLACNPRAIPAVLELYTWLVRDYLPVRFPTVYKTIGPHTLNTVTSAQLPWTFSSETLEDAGLALQLMGENIDNEFLILLPSTNPSDEGKYRLEAFMTCFPSGFNTRSKLGLLLNEIHGPVPGYKERLERSMDRFFAGLPVGKVVKRANWSISTNGELFCLKGNHMSEEEMRRIEEGGGDEEIDLGRTVLRCERQTLHRMPISRALVFAFKTYQYPISELRDEGSGEILAEAIDGLGKGNIPEITVYKRQVLWGEKVKAFLKGEINV